MPDQLQLRGGTTVQHSTFTGASKEVTVDTTKKTVVVHDGSTVGGVPMMREDASNAALALGSAGTPSLKFTGDPNTGLFSPGADQLAISTNGTGRLFVDSTGLVGVGVSAPASLFHLNASASGGGAIFSNQGYNCATVSQVISSADAIFGGGVIASNVAQEVKKINADPAHYVKIQTGDGISFHTNITGALGTSVNRTTNERLRITSAGLVGIGTSSPNVPLEVVGNIHMSGAADRTIFNRANNALSLGTNNTARLHITNAGNVGIGTTSPQNILHLAGSSPQLILDPGSGSTDPVSINSWRTNSPITFRPGDTERARIDGSGRLLVGTTSAFVEGFNNGLTASQLSKGSGSNVRCISDTRTVAAVNNSTVDAWVGRLASGNPYNQQMVGHFYVQVGSANAFSGVYSIVTTSLGTSDATLTAVSTVTRDTSPVSSVQIANDGAGGAIKLTITYINNAGVVNGLESYVSFVGLAK